MQIPHFQPYASSLNDHSVVQMKSEMNSAKAIAVETSKVRRYVDARHKQVKAFGLSRCMANLVRHHAFRQS